MSKSIEEDWVQGRQSTLYSVCTQNGNGISPTQ